MTAFIDNKRTPPPPHLEIRVSGARGGARLLAALCAAALLFASCEKPTDPGGGGGTEQTGGSGGGTPKPDPASYTAAVRGTVPDSSGAKLPGVTVSASTTPVTKAETDANGAFSLRITHSGSLTFTLTMEKACYEAAPAKSVTLTSNTPHDTGITILPLKPEPTEEGDRYTFTQKDDGSYKLTVKECVTTIPQSEFSTDNTPAFGRTVSPILQGLAASSGKSITSVLTEIELPSTLKYIRKFAFFQNLSVSGDFTIPKNVEEIGDSAFYRLSRDNVTGRDSGNIASSQAPAITFASGSRLRTIGEEAFSDSGSKSALVLPDGLQTIGNYTFKRFVMPSTDLVIPASVRKIGREAFVSAQGINDGVTILSTNLIKGMGDPPLGTNLFGGAPSTATRGSTITTIKLPRDVYESYLNTSGTPRSDLDAIFGSEVTAYQDLEGNTL